MFIFQVWRKLLEPFSKYSLLVPFPFCPITLPFFRFSPKPGNYPILCIKFGVSVFISFGDVKCCIFPTQSHTYTHMHQFSKTIFCTKGISKHVNQGKSQYQKFWPKTIFPLSNDTRLKEVKHREAWVQLKTVVLLCYFCTIFLLLFYIRWWSNEIISTWKFAF